MNRDIKLKASISFSILIVIISIFMMTTKFIDKNLFIILFTCGVFIFSCAFVLNIKKSKNKFDIVLIAKNNNEDKLGLYSELDTCVICGMYCPEGRQVCSNCEKTINERYGSM